MRILIGVVLSFILALPVYAGPIQCGHGVAPCGTDPTQGGVSENQQVTSGVTAAVSVTLTAAAGFRHFVHHVEARCNTAAATSNLLISDAGTNIWTTAAAEVGSAANFVRDFGTAISSAAVNTQMVVTLAACTAGTGTLIVQAERW